MAPPSIELHCHTMFSPDGFGSPEQLVDIAAANGVQRLAITEHNTIASYERAKARAQQHSISYHLGVEIDALWQDQNFHFLAYDFDPADATLLEILERNFSVYEDGFREMHPLLQDAFPNTPEIEELRAFVAQKEPTHPAPIVSTYQWRAWLRERSPDFFENPANNQRFHELRAQAVANRKPGTRPPKPTYAEARDAVHNAGGIILLAHIGKAGELGGAPKERKVDFLQHLLAEEGLDGFELYHPFNRDEHEVNREHPFFADIRALGRQWDCVMSGGSDCHNCLNPPAPFRAVGSCGAPVDLFNPAKARSRRR